MTNPAIAAALNRWMALGVAQQRIAESLAAEIGRTSGDMATETNHLTRLFQDLAGKAEAQSQRVSSLSSVADQLVVSGQTMKFDELARLFEQYLAAIVTKILLLSQNAMAMVYALDEVSSSMAAVENCIQSVDKINGQTRMLAINARIEAARAGQAGRAFTVIADEVRGLSGTTQQLAETMRTHIAHVVRGLKQSHEALRTVATIDMSENIMAKDKIDLMVSALIERSATLRAIADGAALDASSISQEVGSAIVSLQFQDRVSQRLEQVMDTLHIVSAAIGRLREETADSADCSAADLTAETEWLQELASRYKLSDMRAAFIARVIDGRDAPHVAESDADPAGSIDLF